MADNEDADEVDTSQAGGKAKRWSWKPVDAYFVNLNIRTCVEVYECGETVSNAAIQFKVMDIWHRR
jgi:hypothetical protein